MPDVSCLSHGSFAHLDQCLRWASGLFASCLLLRHLVHAPIIWAYHGGGHKVCLACSVTGVPVDVTVSTACDRSCGVFIVMILRWLQCCGHMPPRSALQRLLATPSYERFVAWAVVGALLWMCAEGFLLLAISRSSMNVKLDVR
jgi:hypothetical protein